MKHSFAKRLVQFPLRVRLALWSGLLVLVMSFALLFFINSMALRSFPSIVGSPNFSFSEGNTPQHTPPVPPPLLSSRLSQKPVDPLTGALLFELQSSSLVGLGLVALLGSAGAYWFAGLALRPVRKMSASMQQISANTLYTRLAIDGPHDEVKELADTFDTMLSRLENTFELQRNFIGDIAHELRTPLASLRSNLEVVTTSKDPTMEDYAIMAGAQERALTRLERLIADLLILAKEEQPLFHEEVSLGPVLEEVLSDLEHTAQERQVRLQLMNKADIVVQGDTVLLMRVFSNLIENGIRYNRDGGSVSVTIDRKDDWGVVTVADTGAGIPPEKIAYIFDRFYRVDTSRARHKGGAGLGLSIVKTIVQQHHGQVKVASVPGSGSVFTILLPLQ